MVRIRTGRALMLATVVVGLTAITTTFARADEYAGSVGAGVSGRVTLRVHRQPDRFRLDARYVRVPCNDGSTVSANYAVDGKLDKRGRFAATTTTSAPAVGAESFLYVRGRIKVHHAFGRLFIYVNPNDELRDPSVRCATPVKLRWDAQRRGASDPR